MNFKDKVVVNAPIGKVWDLLEDMEAVVPCMPGASYLGLEGEDHKVGMKSKIGVISANFKGKLRFVEVDSDRHVVKIEGTGKDTGGKGGGSAVIVGALQEVSPNETMISIDTEMKINGRIAQFGKPILADIAKRLVAQFIENLQSSVLDEGTKELEQNSEVSSSTKSPVAQSAPENASDLGMVLLPVIVKYSAIAIAAILIIVLVWKTVF